MLPFLNAIEKVIQIYEEIEDELRGDGHNYSSPLFEGLTFDSNTMSFNVPVSDFERYYNFLTNSKNLKPYVNELRFENILNHIKKNKVRKQ